MIDPSTLDQLNDALGQHAPGERLLNRAVCTVQTRSSLGSEGLLGVTATRVLFASSDGLHGTQVGVWSRDAVTDALLRTDLFGPKLTLRTGDGEEIVASGFADPADAPALLAVLDPDLGDAPLTMEPQPSVAFFDDPEPTAPLVDRSQESASRSSSVLVLAIAGAVVMLALVGGIAFVLLLAPTPEPPRPPDPVEATVPQPPAPALPAPPEPLGETTLDTAEPPSDDHGLDAETVSRVIGRASLTRCFGEALDRGAGFEGDLALNIVIQPDGTVGAAGVDDSAGVDGELAGCVTGRLTRLRFPAFEGDEPQNVSWVLRVEN